MDVSQIVLTAEGRKKLEEELAYLEGEKSREIVEHIKEARAFGDLSENAEYDAAKEDNPLKTFREHTISSRNFPFGVTCAICAAR